MVYVHIPFCESFCTYCDFYSELACKGGFEAFQHCLGREIEERAGQIRSTAGVNTLYFGGGTPSLLSAGQIASIAGGISKVFSPDSFWTYDEFTVEVNPEDIVRKGEEYVRALLEAGVNRISMGVQSLSDEILRWMNRRHDAAGARQAFSILRSAGVENISVDVIFGVAGLDDAVLESTVAEILSWKPEHISAYQLSIEEGSALARMVAEGRYTEASDEQCRVQYELICSLLSGAGYHHYEISNWALPGKEAVHNSAYWERCPYVGLGPGAHSLAGNVRSWNSENLSEWSSQSEILGEQEIREEELMLGLRTEKGYGGMVIPEKDWFIADSIIADYATKIL